MNRHILYGLFDSEAGLMNAARECRDRGVPIADAYSPYPLHGIDEIADIPRSKLTVICFFGCVTGLAIGLAFQYWTTAVSWPLNVGGKPFNSLPAFTVVGFEMTVLIGGLTTALFLLALSRLWPGKSDKHVIEGITDDRFALAVGDGDDPTHVEAGREILDRHGALRCWEKEQA